MPHLVVRQPGRLPLTVPLQEGLTIGRHEQNALVLEDAQVSRRHAAFSCEGGAWEVRDLGSRHGTVVNGQRAGAQRLADGDCIQLGQVLLDFHEDDEPQRIVHHQVTAPDAPPRDERADQRLGLLYDVSRAIGDLGDTEAMLGRLLEGILELLDCERALAGIGDVARGIGRRVERRRGGAAGEVVLSRAVLVATLDRREALLVRDAPGEAGPRTMVRDRVRSAMAAPIGVGARPAGVLYVDDRREAARFTARDLDFLVALGHLLGAAIEGAQRVQRAEAAAEAASRASAGDELLGESPAMVALRADIARYAAAGHAHALIRGESGTGKELAARALHAASPRASRPFVTLNCAAIPDTMLESELFGHEKGAFTGALRARRGSFALADGGTLFLDEIGDLALPAQAKLLRAVQEGEIQPLGAERPARVDVRIVSATHRDLRAEVAAGRFREDIYYRLAVVELSVPPLRARPGDVRLLAGALLAGSAAALGKRLTGFTAAALAALERHDWPGHVRELRNEIERAAIRAEGPLVDADALSPALGAARQRTAGPRGRSLAERFAELEPTERQLVEEALAEARGNLSEAARLLGISRIMIRRRVERFGLRARDDE
ncbi:MAG: sigma 54-interacting transcriptional regulator [Polyangiaceae bacterium]|nr:sigma 54-interacting transcriptional regulator [Polyangiaceae bacterium]